MKKIFLAALILHMGYFSAQKNKKNRFMEEDLQAANTEVMQAPAATAAGPPGGGDGLPIDDYVPLLVITALAIISYSTYKRKTVS